MTKTKTNAETSTLDQKRAKHALEAIKNLVDENKDYGHYTSYVSSLPATIIINGLGQALVTLLAKSKGKKEDPHHLLYDHVASWLSKQIEELRCPSKTDFTQLIERLMDANQNVYLRAQAEAMAYLNWLKQFARAFLEEKEGQSNDN